MKDAKGVITFDGYRVESFQFDWDVSVDMQGKNNYRYNINYAGELHTEESKQLDLRIRIFSNAYETYDESPLKLELILAGLFHKSDNTSWDDRWDANALAILFPYARSIISSFTAQSGFETINLPTINTSVVHETEPILAEKKTVSYE